VHPRVMLQPRCRAFAHVKVCRVPGHLPANSNSATPPPVEENSSGLWLFRHHVAHGGFGAVSHQSEAVYLAVMSLSLGAADSAARRGLEHTTGSRILLPRIRRWQTLVRT
jgi:hypothetical protein